MAFHTKSLEFSSVFLTTHTGGGRGVFFHPHWVSYHMPNARQESRCDEIRCDNLSSTCLLVKAAHLFSFVIVSSFVCGEFVCPRPLSLQKEKMRVGLKVSHKGFSFHFLTLLSAINVNRPSTSFSSFPSPSTSQARFERREFRRRRREQNVRRAGNSNASHRNRIIALAQRGKPKSEESGLSLPQR
jgi:hypothetical protein